MSSLMIHLPADVMSSSLPHSLSARSHTLVAMAPSELASIAEIAELLRVPKRTAARYVDRPDFPPPADTLEVGRIWRVADVQAWATATLPLKPGPKPAQK